jgi:hypothetical protein
MDGNDKVDSVGDDFIVQQPAPDEENGAPTGRSASANTNELQSAVNTEEKGDDIIEPDSVTTSHFPNSKTVEEVNDQNLVPQSDGVKAIAAEDRNIEPPNALEDKTAAVSIVNADISGGVALDEAEKEPVVEVIKRDPNLVLIALRPVNKDWVMGEDWMVDLHNSMTLQGIRGYIEEHRGISRHRIQLRMKGKVVPANRESWTIRRLGFYDGYLIQVEPTLSMAWMWNPIEWYHEKLLSEVCEIVTNTVTPTGTGRINLKELSAKIQPPPCIKTSLRVFLRKYPERVYIHTDVTDGSLWVHCVTRPYQLPTFGNFSVEIGTFPYFKPKYYNWAANKDIDDMYKIETLPPEEEEEQEGGDEDVSQKKVLTAEEKERLIAMGDGDGDTNEGGGDD